MATSHGDTMRRTDTVRRIGVVVGLLAAAVVSLVGSSALARPHQPTTGITAVDARTGQQLPANPVLHVGQRVVLSVPEFAPSARVVVALVGVRRLAVLGANSRGVVAYDFTVAGWISRGQHTLIFSGPAPRTSAAPPSPTVGSRPRRDPAPFQVTVPYHPQWAFRVGAPAPPPPGDGHGQAGGGSGPPAATGFDLVALASLGVVLLAAGLLAFRASRRRPR